MNKQRRKRITEIFGQLEVIGADLEGLRDAEQEAFDAMPEGLQHSERGEQAEAAISALESAIGEIENARNSLEEVETEES